MKNSMKNHHMFQSVLIALCLLVSAPSFSKKLDLKTNKIDVSLITPTVSSFSPLQGHAGTIVTITGTDFTSTSVVKIGTTIISSTNVTFESSTKLIITIPCGLSSGNIFVDDVDSNILFTYIAPTISNVFTNLSYCEGTTVTELVLSGTPTNPTTSNGLLFSWTNSNTAIGLSSSGTGNIPTFTGVNTTNEPITSTITITPSINGCMGVSKNYTITINPKPIINPIATIVTCAGSTISSINLTASSPNSGTGTSFSWSGTNNTAIGLSTTSGTTSPIPSFTATNSTNNTISSTITVTPSYQVCIGNPTTFTIDVNPISLGGTLTGNTSICSGATSGLLSLSGYSGTILHWESSTTGSAPWTTIANTSSTYQSGGLTQTTYYRVAVQNSGCPIAYSNTITITVNNTPSISGNLNSCIGGTSQLSASLPAASNAWQSSNPTVATISTTGLVTGISPGTTIITFTNANGCSTTVNFTVHQQPFLVVSNPSSVCTPNTVNLTLPAVTAGSDPNLTFTYFTNAGATTPLSTPNMVSTSGTYHIKGTDGNGCSTINSVVVLINSLPTISISGNNSICSNESTILTASGANTYSWNGGNGSTASITVAPTTTTTYTVNGTDNNGCTGTGSYTVNVKSLPTVNAGTDKNICAGSTVTLTATGTGISSVSWNNAISDGVAFQPASTTTYAVTALGTNGCYNTDSVLVSVNPLPNAPQINVIQPTCSSTTGSIAFSGLPSTGNWTINPGGINGSGGTYTLNGQSVGNYNFTVKDSNQCTSASSNTIINAAPITPTAPTLGTITQPTCANPTGSVILNGLPTGNWTITKLPGGETYSASGGNPYPVTNLTAGTYTFSVSNGTCSSLASSIVVIDATPLQNAPIVGTIVQPTCFVATGSVTLNGLPSGNWTLTRLQGGATLTSTGTNTTISGLNSGVYNYSVTNSDGCTSSYSANITIDAQPPTPVAPIANAQSFLVSDNATVSDLQIVSTGTPNWYNSPSIGTALNVDSLLTTGTYYASRTVNGCESIDRIPVTVSVFPDSIGGAVSGSTTVCSGTNSTTLILSGQTGTVVKWQSASDEDFLTNLVNITNAFTSYTGTNLTTSLYFRAVVQSGTAPVEYSSPAFIDVTSQSIGGTLSTSTSICRGETSGLLTLSGFNGTIIRWEQSDNNGATWSTISNTSNSYTSGSLNTTTQYRAIVQNGVCNEAPSSVVTITVKSTPVVTDIPNQEVCFGETRTFGDAFIADHSYTWTSDLGYSSTLPQVNITFNQVVTQNYTYTITNTSTGCSAQDQFQIVVNPIPNPVVIPHTSICVGNSIAIGGNSTVGSTYSWSSIPAGFTSNLSNPLPIVNPTVTTTYILEETTAAGCKKSNDVTITVQPDPTSSITTGPSVICETDANVFIEASVSNDFDSIAWEVVPPNAGNIYVIPNTFGKQIEFTPTAVGISATVPVIVRHTLTNKCGESQTPVDFPITIQKQAVANAGISVSTCDSNSVQLNGAGSINATTYSWTKPTNITGTLTPANSATPTYTPSAADIDNYTGPIPFTLTVSSGSACSIDQATVNVTLIKKPVISAGPANTTICEDDVYTIAPNVASVDANTASYTWKTSGDGQFTNGNTLEPTYTPGINDKAGTVTLTLEAVGNFPCTTVTSQTVLSITKKPVLNYSNQVVCGDVNTPISITGSIQNAGRIEWIRTNGSGSFDDATIQNPHYTPDVLDMNGNPIIFRLRVYNKNGCDINQYVEKFIEYTINAKPVVSAGVDFKICEGATYSLPTASKSNATVSWTSVPTGYFNDPTQTNPIFTPNGTDLSYTLKITGTQPGCDPVTDNMVLTIQKNPVANAGADHTICQGDTIYFSGSAPNAISQSWTQGLASGVLNQSTTLSPNYVSDPNESGTFIFTLTAQPDSPTCTNPSVSTTKVTVIAKPTARFSVLPAQDSICEGEDYTVSTALASNYSIVEWSSNGTGNFLNKNTLTPTYQPSINDINEGSVKLILTAKSNSPCADDAVAEMTLTINKKPVVSVVYPNQDICTDETVPVIISGPGDLFGVSAENYDSLSWSSSSGNNSGFFDQTPDDTTVTNTYLPSADDIANGSVILTLRAIRGVSPGGCNSIDENIITLKFIKKPVANAGPDIFICEDGTYISTTTNTSALNHTSVVWSSNGSPNTIANKTSLTGMIYTPTQEDIDRGSVTLTLTAYGDSCQPKDDDDIIISFKKLPIITVPDDVAMCANQNSYQIGGVSVSSVSDYDPTSIDWLSTGTGTFSPSGDPINPIYEPSDDDIAAGSVELTIKVNSITPCATSVSEKFKLSFQKLPVASAGSNLTTCALPFQITSATADLTTVNNLVWSTSGTGTFDYYNILNPIYTPSAADILSVNPIRLTLTANPIAPCADPKISFVDVTLVKTPIITVVTPQPIICEDETNVLVNGTVVQYYDKIKWTSTTGTEISNDASLTPLVTPSAADKAKKSIELTLTVTPLAPCATEVTRKVIIPIQLKPTVNAGASQTICEGSVITTTGALSSNVTNLTWNNNGGDGTFTTSNLNTITEYTPGPNEIATGKVRLTLSGDAISRCLGTATSTVEHLITKNPVITVNPTVVSICESQSSYQVPLSQITVINPTSIQSIQWTTTNQAKLTGDNTFTPTYTFTQADIDNGSVVLTATITPTAPCAAQIIETITLNIFKKATIDATQTNYTFCENTPKPLRAVFANHNPATRSWRVVSGGGTITPPNNSDNPTYNPDASSSIVVIEVSVASNNPCTELVTEQFTLNVIKKPIVTFAKTVDTICNTKTTYDLDVSNVTITNDSPTTSYRWSKSVNATGNFVDANDKHTIYNFSAADLASSTPITLTLQAKSGDGLCTLIDTESIEITIKPLPIVTITSSGVICEGNPYNATATATNQSSVEWTTVGSANGILGYANSNVATYTPGTNDSAGFTLQFTATGSTQCASVSATKTVTIQKLPILDAGDENRYNCSSQPFQITGVTGSNTATISWSSSSGVNSGTFSNPTIKNPIYTPSAAEIALGTPIRLTISATGIAPCSNTVSDFIILNLEPKQVVNAGLDQTICEDSSVTLTGVVSNTSSVYWTSSSSGNSGFANPNAIATTYTPSAADILNRTVTLTLHGVSDSNCLEVIDTMIVTILEKPTANAGAIKTICEGTTYTLLSGDATATNYSSISWTATGPGQLDSTTINTLTPRYSPAAGQVGDVTLTLTAQGYAACGINAVSTKTINITPKPVVNISSPSTRTICQGESLNLAATEVTASNYSSLQWTVNGLGNFAPNNSAATVFTPTASQSGTVTLKLTATALNAACQDTFKELNVTIIPKPIINAGSDASICQTSSGYTILDASIPLGSTFRWEITGPATIDLATITTDRPKIVPNSGASGTVTLTLVVQDNSICSTPVTDQVTITINPSPNVNAGADGTLCQGIPSYALSGTVTNAAVGTTYLWTTNGSGTIINQNALNTTYTPGGNDFISATGIKVITFDLVATSTNGCAIVSDSRNLTVYAKPIVTAGLDRTDVCEGTSVTIVGADAKNYSSVTWTKSVNADGNFDFTSSLVNPTYTLGSNDTSSVTLTISAMPNAACPQVAVTDAMTIFINKKPTIVASTNEITMCAETFTLPDLVTVSDASSILWTNTTPVANKSIILNLNSETPILTPTADEITKGYVELTVKALPKANCSITPEVTAIIRVNLIPRAKATLGADFGICQGSTITISGSVTNTTDYTWTHTGTGSFGSTITSLNPTYTPGVNEIGAITFTLTPKNDVCSVAESDSIVVTINSTPIVSVGQDATICKTSTYNLFEATASNYNNLNSNLEWKAYKDINGLNAADGTFTNPNSLNPTYTPSQNDILSGKVYLTLRVNNNYCSVQPVSDTLLLTISPETGVNAGSYTNLKVCEGNSFILSNAFADNTSGLTWSSSQFSNGTSSPTYDQAGSFDNKNLLNATYTPGPDDINNGAVYLTLNGQSNSSCPSKSSTIKLEIVKKPTVSASDIQMCMSNTAGVVLNGTGANYATLNWSKISGPASGYINNGRYFTGLPLSTPTNEVAKLRLVATPLSGCTVDAVTEITVNIQALPIVEAGSNGATCYIPGQPIAPFSIIGSSVANASSSTWTTSGLASGIFNVGTPVIYQSYSNSCNPETLTLTANGIGACSSTTVSDAVILAVNCTPPSLGIIGGNTTVCQGTSSVVYTVAIDSNVQTYNWQVPTGATIVSGQGTNSISVDYGTNAISGTISVNGINGCGSGISSTLAVTVNQRPSSTTITGPQTLCIGTSYTFTANLIANADSYEWKLSNGSTVISTFSTPNNTLTIPATVSGNLSVQGFSTTCGLGDASANHTITVVPLPILNSGLPADICSNTVFNYIPSSATIGVTFTWTRALQSGISNPAASGTGVINETLLNTTNALVPVNYTITTTNTNGCSKSEIVTVRVKPIPSLTSAAPVAAICSGTVFEYEPTSDATGAIVWSRATVAGISETGISGSTATNSKISETLTNTTLSPITVSYVLNLPAINGCTGPSKIINLIVNPSPNVTSQSSQVLCEGDALGINFATTNIGGTSTFNWTNSNTNIGLAAIGSGSVPTFTLLNTSTVNQVAHISVTPMFTNGGISCSGSSLTFDITVNPTADVNQPSDQVICNGSTTTAIVFSTTNTTGTTTYSWTNDNTSIGLGSTGNGTITPFIVTNATAIPQIATIVVTPTYTSGGVSCVGLPKTFRITVNPTANVVQPSSSVVCANSLVNSIFATTNTVGTTTYSWTNDTTSIGLAASGNGSITPPFIALNSGATPVVATINVTPTYTNAGLACTGAVKTFTITVNPAAQVNSVSDITKCKGDSVSAINFSTTNTIGTTTYAWTNSNPSIGLGVSGSGDIPTFIALNSGTAPAIATITVTPTFTNNGVSCTGPVKVFTITVNPTADMIQPVSKVVCNGETTSVNFATTNTGTTTYSWSSDIAIGMSTLSSTGSIANFTATNSGNSPIVATITVAPTYTNNGVSCVGLPKTFTITVNPSADVNQPVTPLVLCNGTPTSVNFTTNNIGGTTTYSWTNNTPSIGISSSGIGSINTFPVSNLGTTPLTANLTVTPTFANAGKTCTGATKNFVITINPTAQVNQPNSQVRCNGEAITPIGFSTQNTVGTTTYSWTNDTPGIGLNASGTGDITAFNPVNMETTPITATIVVTPSYTNGGVVCTGPTKTFTITVNPVANVSQPTSLILCNGVQTNVNFTTANSGGVTSYSWTNDTSSIGLNATGFGSIPNFTVVNNGNTQVVANFVVTPIFSNAGKSCSGTTKIFTITVNPTAQVVQPASEVICNGGSTTTVNFATTYTSGVTTFAWTNSNTSIGLSASGTGSIPSFTGTNLGTTPQVATIVVTPTYTEAGVSCTGPSKTFTITVNPTPQVNQPTAQVICNGDTYSLNFSSLNTGGTTTYSWTNNNTAIGLNVATSTGSIPSFTAVNTGLAPTVATITVTPTYINGGVSCVGLPKSFTITVNPTADVIQPTNQVVCNGVSTAGITFSSLNNSGTTTYSWTNSNANIGLGLNGSGAVIPAFNAVNTGNIPIVATITVTPSYTNAGVVCTGPSKTFTITVNPTAELIQPTNQIVCNGASTTLVNFISNNLGGATSYTWVNNNTTIGLASNGAINIPSFNAVNIGTTPVVATIVVTPTFSNAGQTCAGPTKSFTITVNPSAEVVQPIATTLCNGDTSNVINFTSLNSVGTTTYTWTNTNTSIGLGLNGSVSAPSFTAINTSTSPITSTVTVTPVYTNGGLSCSGSNKTFAITVNPSAGFNQPVSQELCSGATTTAVSFTTVNTGGTTTYSWTNSNPSIGIPASGSGAIPAYTVVNSGATPQVATITITATYSNAGKSCTTAKSFTITVHPSPKATISSTNSFIVCQNDVPPSVTFTGSNGTPPFLFTYSIGTNNYTVSSSGTSNSAMVSLPTVNSGNYTVTLLSVQDSSTTACTSTTIISPNQAFVTVQEQGTIIPVSSSTVTQTECQGNSIIPIVFTIGGSATSAYVTNLPAGLTGTYDGLTHKFTISGSPTATGIFNYVIHTAGSTNGCNSTYGGTLTVKADDVITALTPTTTNQSVCATAPIQSISYNLGGGATGGDVTFSPHQPNGIVWSAPSNVLTISGATNEVGVFTYTVQSYGICDQTTYSGTIEIKENATVRVVSGNPNPTVCINNSLGTALQYGITTTTSATMVHSGTLPTGVSFNATTGSFSGVPTQSGSFPYTISSSTGCGNVLSGVISVNPAQSIADVSGNTSQINSCVNSAIDPILFKVASGVTSIIVSPALPAGITYSLDANNIVTILGTPTSATTSTSTFTLTTQGSCGSVATATITFDIKPAATITFISSASSLNQSVCQNGPIVPIQFTIGGGASGILQPILPTGLTITRDGSGVYTISGNPTANGTFTIPITTTGCPVTQTITITNINSVVSISLTSATGTDNQTQCQSASNSAIVPIKYATVGTTGVIVSGLPTGVTSSFNIGTGELTISGTPTKAGIFNYTITTLPCNIVKTGVLKVSTPISISNESVKNVTCSTASNGEIAVTIVGGVTSGGFYAVHWSGPNGFQQNQTNILGLEAGNYTISGTDAVGCPLPTKTYTVLPALPITISLVSTTNVTCNNALGCANFDYTGGTGIFTHFDLEYLDSSSQMWNVVPNPNNNYFNICNLKAGLYRIAVTDSNSCKTEPYVFTIYDYSTLKIAAVSLDETLCANTAGKVRVTVSSLDNNLTFYYNSVVVPSVDLGNHVFELSIASPTTPSGIIKVTNSQNCWDTTTVNTSLVDPKLNFTSINLTTYGNVSVNESVKFTNGLTSANIPAEYDHIVWDFGDNSPYKVFYNPEDINPNSSGESITTVFHTYAIDGLYPVTLTVYNKFGCSRSITEILTVGQGAGIMLPTAFSPNNDGINDLFRPSLLGLKEVSMYIYDNWGNLIYEVSSDTASLPSDWGWNGIEKVNSEPVNGTYRYYIMAKTINDKIIEKEGQFMLIK
jgi:gliding motility-associated-like protein